MKVLVCGGRDYSERDTVFGALYKIDPKVVIHGGASGADWIASLYCTATCTPEMIFRASWELEGRAAGPIRNQRMLDEGKPDLVVAFPGGNGTADMVRRARKAGVRVNDLRTMEER